MLNARTAKKQPAIMLQRKRMTTSTEGSLCVRHASASLIKNSRSFNIHATALLTTHPEWPLNAIKNGGQQPRSKLHTKRLAGAHNAVAYCQAARVLVHLLGPGVMRIQTEPQRKAKRERSGGTASS